MTGLVADFATRLALGLGLALLLAPWRAIPPKYFRTMCLVLLGLSLLAAFDLGFAGDRGRGLVVAIIGCACAYAGAIAWGLGYVRLGQIALALTAAAALFAQTQLSNTGRPGGAVELWALTARAISAFLLGAALAAMLLGHHYLTAPTMSIAPLQRMIALVAVALLCQAVVATIQSVTPWEGTARAASGLLLGMRWLFGIAAPAIGTVLAWRTARIRSTQSATGILYAVTTLVLLGELAALVLGRTHGAGY